MKLYKTAAYLGAFSYILLGLLTIGGIINSTIGLYINLIMGVFFITIGCYLYLRAKSIIKLLPNIKDLNNEKQETLNAITRFLFFEKIFITLSLLLGIILLSGAISRVFLEKMPIFG